MDAWSTAPTIGSGLCLVVGFIGLFRPKLLAAQTGLVADGPLGRSELRAVFGGVLLGIGGACLFLAEPLVYLTGALAFFGAVLAKAASVLFDGAPALQVGPGLLLDLGIGLLLAAGA